MQNYSGPDSIGDKQIGTFAKDKPGNAVFAYEG
jgi:hypothetical protein